MFLYVVLAVCMLASQTEARRVRVRRQDCPSGKYNHNGNTCCMCGPGYKVQEHCTNSSKTSCEPCETGQYQSYATGEKTCERCTSCEHLNANLVVDSHCTPLVDSTCKCKENHYCSSGAEFCKICEPCQVCSEGIKVPCSATNNTICNDKSTVQDNTGAIAVGSLVVVIVVVAVLAGAVLYIKKKRKPEGRNIQNGAENPPDPEENIQLLGLGPHIPEVAEAIGWTNMRNLAMQNQISKGRIESCEQDHPTSSTERTIALLRIWEEKESKSASPKLVQYLRQTNQNKTADAVQAILSGGSS